MAAPGPSTHLPSCPCPCPHLTSVRAWLYMISTKHLFTVVRHTCHVCICPHLLNVLVHICRYLSSHTCSLSPVHHRHAPTCPCLPYCTCFCPHLSQASISMSVFAASFSTHLSVAHLLSVCACFPLVTFPLALPHAYTNVHRVMREIYICVYARFWQQFSHFTFGSWRFAFTGQRDHTCTCPEILWS